MEPSVDARMEKRSEESRLINKLPTCPVCGAELIDIRQKRVCPRCHTICETCCEGGRG